MNVENLLSELTTYAQGHGVILMLLVLVAFLFFVRSAYRFIKRRIRKRYSAKEVQEKRDAARRRL